MRRILLAASSAAFAVLAMLAPVGNASVATSSASKSVTLRVIQYNITGAAAPGNVANSLPNNGSLKALQYLKYQMGQFPSTISGGTYPDAVLLEETCAQQYKALKREFTPNATKTYVVFAEMVRNHRLCPGTKKAPKDHRLGLVLLSRWPLSNVTNTPLGYTDKKTYTTPDKYTNFRLLCGDMAIPGISKRVRACVTHLRKGSSPTYDQYKPQVDTIAKVLNPKITAGQPVIVGGDLNNLPGYRTLDPLYHLDRVGGLAGPGKMYEGDQLDTRYFDEATTPCTVDACRSGEKTTNALDSKTGLYRDYYKYDYLFYSGYTTTNGGFTDFSALALPFNHTPTSSNPYPSLSDHKLYRSQAVLHY
jgi:hypothetical protein